MADIKLIKQLRSDTGAGIADVRQALDEAAGDANKAREIISKKGLDKALAKSQRQVKAGLVEVYGHAGRVGVVLELRCETDFVAKTDDFKNLAHELSLQIASMQPRDVTELLSQEYIRDNSQTVRGLIQAVVGKLGENIKVGKFCRIELGADS